MADVQITPADVMQMGQVMVDLGAAFASVGQECTTISNDVGLAAADASGAAKAIEKGAFEVFKVLGDAFHVLYQICGKSGELLEQYVKHLTELDNGISETIGKINQYSDEAGQAAGAISGILSAG
jgi:hypothetical protein